MSYYARGRYDEAAAAYEKALAVNPRLAESHNYLGLTRYAQGKYGQAQIHFNQALALGYKVDPRVLESTAGMLKQEGN